MINSRVSILAMVIVAVCTGCASTPESTASATHYWYSETSKPKREYNSDNTNCMQASNAEQTQALATESPSYQAYRDCMIHNGYTLRRY